MSTEDLKAYDPATAKFRKHFNSISLQNGYPIKVLKNFNTSAMVRTEYSVWHFGLVPGFGRFLT